MDGLFRKPAVGKGHHKFSPRFQNPPHLLEHSKGIGKIFHGQRTHHNIKGTVLELQGWIQVQILNPIIGTIVDFLSAHFR